MTDTRTGVPVRFPLDTLERVLAKQHMSRADWHDLFTRTRAWELWLHGVTFMDMRPQDEDTNMKFVDYKLTDEQKKLALGLYEGEDDLILDAMDEVTLTGYRVTFSYDKKGRCAIVSVIGRDPECVNFDLCMTSRHASVRRALMYAMYKQQIVFDNGAWGDDSGESVWG